MATKARDSELPAAACRQYAAENFSVGTMVRRYEAIYQAAIATRDEARLLAAHPVEVRPKRSERVPVAGARAAVRAVREPPVVAQAADRG